VEDLARLRQLGRAAAPVDEANVETAFQFSERLGDGRLTEAKLCGRLCEAAVVNDGGKQAEVAEIECHYLSSWNVENNVLAL
jgi:hypothetical protein